MNLANDGAKYGIDQYRFARNYDLMSKSFNINANGSKYSITFEGRDKLSFVFPVSPEKTNDFEYECLKIEDDTYFVSFGANVAVLEITCGLATLLLGKEIVFGVIEIAGKPVPEQLHALTDEMTGTAVCWMMGCNKYTNHIYFADGKCRAAWSPEGDKFAVNPTVYIRIKDGIYLVKVEGVIPDSIGAPPGSSSFISLQDYDHMMFVGCIQSENAPQMVSGYGEFPEFDKALFS